MGFTFYVCDKCGQVNSESDLGSHEEECTEPKCADEFKKKLRKDINDTFKGGFISRRIFSYWFTFWNNFDYWSENRDSTDIKIRNKSDKAVAIVKNFLHGGDYPDFKIMKQSKDDKSKAQQLNFPYDLWEKRREKGYKEVDEFKFKAKRFPKEN